MNELDLLGEHFTSWEEITDHQLSATLVTLLAARLAAQMTAVTETYEKQRTALVAGYTQQRRKRWLNVLKTVTKD